MNKFLKISYTIAVSLATAAFTIIPEDVFQSVKVFSKASESANIITCKLLLALSIFIFSMLFVAIVRLIKQSVKINGTNYNIKISYGNIFEEKYCKILIPFDECFTTKVGLAPGEIKPSSICGQYLSIHPITDMQSLIEEKSLHPARSKSKYQNKIRYDSGLIIPHEEYLLMAFAKLNHSGLGTMSREEYIECLSKMWEEIDKYYSQKDVCIPILGSGITRIGETKLTQQELLDIMIWSYKMSSHKIKNPYTLRIVCKKQDDFSLFHLEESTF